MRGIVMQGASVRAIMAGVKVQTRRIDDGKPPRYAVGERVYVKETIVCVRVEPLGGSDLAGSATVIYDADGSPCPVDRWPWQRPKLSPIYMPYGARRLELVIESRRSMLLQEIGEDDARAEGAVPLQMDGLSYLASFEGMWDVINGKEASWESNPKVWAYGFELVARLV